MDIRVKNYSIPTFSLFFLYTYFTHIAASSTVTDDVTNYVTRGIFNTNWWYSMATKNPCRAHWQVL